MCTNSCDKNGFLLAAYPIDDLYFLSVGLTQSRVDTLLIVKFLLSPSIIHIVFENCFRVSFLPRSQLIILIVIIVIRFVFCDCNVSTFPTDTSSTGILRTCSVGATTCTTTTSIPSTSTCGIRLSPAFFIC